MIGVSDPTGFPPGPVPCVGRSLEQHLERSFDESLRVYRHAVPPMRPCDRGDREPNQVTLSLWRLIHGNAVSHSAACLFGLWLREAARARRSDRPARRPPAGLTANEEQGAWPRFDCSARLDFATGAAVFAKSHHATRARWVSMSRRSRDLCRENFLL
jgi:hypothetical protein